MNTFRAGASGSSVKTTIVLRVAKRSPATVSTHSLPSPLVSCAQRSARDGSVAGSPPLTKRTFQGALTRTVIGSGVTGPADERTGENAKTNAVLSQEQTSPGCDGV